MPRARNKEDLLQFSEENYSKLLKMISAMSENQMSTEFDFSDDAGKKEAHWGRDKNVRDVLIHLYEWHHPCLPAGCKYRPFPEPPGGNAH